MSVSMTSDIDMTCSARKQLVVAPYNCLRDNFIDVNGLAICFEMPFRFRNFPPSHFSLLILFSKIFYFCAHNGVSAVDRNLRSEFRLICSIHYDACICINIAFSFLCYAFISITCEM